MMSEMIVLAAVLSAALIAWFAFKSPAHPRFRRKTVMSETELDFFYRLQAALPQCHIFAQVALSALIEPVGMPKARRFAAACIASKRAGYAVFDDEMHLLAVVELSHRARIARKEAALDACLATAGIKTV